MSGNQPNRSLQWSEPGFPDKKPNKLPPIIVDGYNSHGVKTRPPAASRAGVGATNITEIRDATEQRRKHAEAIAEAGAKFRGRLTSTRDKL
jgi:hypothetical protein